MQLMNAHTPRWDETLLDAGRGHILALETPEMSIKRMAK